MSTATRSSSGSGSRAPIITVTPVHDPMDPTTPPTKPPRAAGHHPRGIAFRDVVTRDEAASLARRCLGEDARLVEYYLRPYFLSRWKLSNFD
uniref:Uncharacterized protein n=1 Tax=Trichogramma kaykai TaxID=54128 RepID=A0ABD2XPQ9_9HYME